MIISKNILVRVSSSNYKRYKELGYEFKVVRKDVINVNVEDLSHTARVRVDVECDYCYKKYQMDYDKYIARVVNNPHVKKCACKGCTQLKHKEAIKIKYNVDNISQIDDVKTKRTESFVKRFGFDNPSKSDEVKLKKANTTLKNYGVDNPFKNIDIIKDIQIKKAETMYMMGTQVSSKQQRYICNLIGGALNYNIDKLNLDICFPEEKIYVEYDGSGHDLSMVIGNITKEQFDKNESDRFYFLKKIGWKMIKIISGKDFIPTDEKIIEVFNKSKELLKNGSWVKIYIDSNKIESSKVKLDFDFGILRILPRRKRKIKV